MQPGPGDAAIRSDIASLRTVVIAAGICWSVLFVVIGLGYELQMYGDGSLFSYAVAVQDAWAFHWHNISGRLFVYLFCYVPAETYVELTRDAGGGIVVYGFLFFVAPLLGLVATFAADRSKGRIVFCTACASTACLCPLVFGFPTEMWMAQALFWPALAVCHYARGGIARDRRGLRGAARARSSRMKARWFSKSPSCRPFCCGGCAIKRSCGRPASSSSCWRSGAW